MKKSIQSLIFTLFLFGCSQYNEYYTSKDQTSFGSDIYATISEDENTRTYVENRKFLRWHAQDSISFFDGITYNDKYIFNGETGDNAGSFSQANNNIITGNALNNTYAVYPYNSDTSISDQGVISYNIPTQQFYAEESFGKGANIMVAVGVDKTDRTLRFYNACGYLVVKLYGEDTMIKSITLKGNNHEKIAGAATIVSSYEGTPQISVSDDGEEQISIICNNAVCVGTTHETATEFWFALPEITFTKGLTITIMDISFREQVKTTNNEVQIVRNTIQPMSAFEFSGVELTIPNNEIWYTTIDNSLFAPYYPSNVNATITSNTITNAKGIITYDTDLASIGYSTIKNNYLESIRLPESVNSIDSSALNGTPELVSIIYPSSVEQITTDYTCEKLRYLYLDRYEKLKRLSLSDYNRTIEELDLRECCPLLESISFCGSKVKQLFLGEKEHLTQLSTGGGYYATSPLQELNLSGCPNLEILDCKKAKLTELNLTGLDKLTSINCTENLLTNIDLKGKSVLTSLSCDDNQITSLDLSDCTSLQVLTCSYNLLTELNVDNCKYIRYLYCAGNQIRVLDISKTWVGGTGSDYYSRPLDCAPMDTLEILYIGSLSGLGKIPYVYPESERDSNHVPSHTQIIKK